MNYIVMREYMFSGNEPRYDYIGKFDSPDKARTFILEEVKASKGYFKLAHYNVYKREKVI